MAYGPQFAKALPGGLTRLHLTWSCCKRSAAAQINLPEAGNPFTNWHAAWNPAERPGYAGTAIFARRPLQVLHRGIAEEPDPEGRVLRVDIDGVDLVSVYLPSGSSSDAAQARKNIWMKQFAPWMATIKRRRRPVLVGRRSQYRT